MAAYRHPFSVAKNEINHDQLGLAHWMHQVVVECERAQSDFSAASVHDLRVALRRCRSLGGVMQCVDPSALWKRMRKAGKTLFSALGDLRDVQIMEEWIQKLLPTGEGCARELLEFARSREIEFKKHAADAIAKFDRAAWNEWAEILPARAESMTAHRLLLEHLALEHWSRAWGLHRVAMRDRSRVGYHNLRIGIKKFRYMVENFLPEMYREFGKDLKHLQDLLGEVHDLDVLWATALKLNKFGDSNERNHIRDIIESQRTQRLNQYREKMVGKSSLWRRWRERLPQGDEQVRGGLERLKTWASFLDPESQNSCRVARLALQLYDALVGTVAVKPRNNLSGRTLLEAAALMRDVGRAKREKKHQKSSYKLILKLDPPFGWQKRDLEMTALIARYHRGTLPATTGDGFHGLTEAQKRQIVMLAGILRLIDAVDRQVDGKVRSLEVEQTQEMIRISAKGKLGPKPSEMIAAARYLLESAYQRPIFVSIRPQAA
jgi:exopolyphosphatase/guanosine-5'-triphosphate,3'-diphosphate pyrophosphatase